MKFICNDCGFSFDSNEAKIYTEYMGECHGRSAYYTFSCCPVCGGDYYEASKCAICENECDGSDLINGICKGCLEDWKSANKYNFMACLSVCGDMKDRVELNSFLLSQFDQKQIEYILLKELVQASAIAPIDCSSFIEGDDYWLAEQIKGVKL